MWKQRKWYNVLTASLDFIMLLGTYIDPQWVWTKKDSFYHLPSHPQAECCRLSCGGASSDGWAWLWPHYEGGDRSVANPRGNSEGQTWPAEQARSVQCPYEVLATASDLRGEAWVGNRTAGLPGICGSHSTPRVSEMGCGIIMSALSLLKSFWSECAIVFFCLWFVCQGLGGVSWPGEQQRPLIGRSPSVSHTQGRALSIFSVTLWHTSQP